MSDRESELIKKYTQPSKKPERVSIFNACRSADTAHVTEYLEKGGCVTECDDNKMTMLHHCAFMGNTDLCRSIIHVAPQTPPDMDAADSDGWTPLHYAADKGHTETVRLLLEEGASVNSKDAMRRTPLHLAALGGHVGVIQVLLEEGATKNAKNIAGMTAKECATTAGHEAASALL